MGLWVVLASGGHLVVAASEWNNSFMLLGRERERQRLRAAFDRARAGTSDVLGLVGEPGIGKTALLRDAAEQAEGMRVLRARGIESQARIAFASLFELLRPALGALGRIPAPQARALEGALALRVSEAHERFAVGAATLSLLAAHAESGPVLVLVDDAHWLDGSSAEALLFAIRRLIADPIAVLLGVRRDEPSLLDGTDVETLVLSGLGAADAAALLPGLAPDAVRRLHLATGGNPLALLELADEPEALALAPEGAPLLVSARIREAFARRARSLSVAERRVLLLAAASDTGDLALLARAAGRLGLDPAGLVAAEQAGVVSLAAGTVEFRHPLARSAVYASARAQARRDVHRALADALPDTDVDRRAWHLANAVAGPDDGAAAALEMAGVRARGRSAYAPAAVAFERAARLASRPAARGRLLRLAAEASWHAGLVERALALLERAQSTSGDGDGDGRLDLEELAGRIAVRRGPVMRGHDILAAVAERVDPERAAGPRAEAAAACFYAGQPAAMLKIAERAWHELPEGASRRTRFLASAAVGMAWVVGGDAAAGERAVERAIALAEGSGELRHDIDLLPWLAVAPIILRDATAGRRLLADALKGARARSAIGTLPFVLTLVALDHATTDRWDLAAATYREAIGLAREGDQRTVLAFGLSGLVRLLARRGDEAECRALAASSSASAAWPRSAGSPIRTSPRCPSSSTRCFASVAGTRPSGSPPSSRRSRRPGAAPGRSPAPNAPEPSSPPACRSPRLASSRRSCTIGTRPTCSRPHARASRTASACGGRDAGRGPAGSSGRRLRRSSGSVRLRGPIAPGPSCERPVRRSAAAIRARGTSSPRRSSRSACCSPTGERPARRRRRSSSARRRSSTTSITST